MNLDLSEDLKHYNLVTGFMCKLVTGLVEKDYINTVLISGPAGIGKSYLVDNILTEKANAKIDPIRYVPYKGHVTARKFFEELRDNSSSDCVLLFDDADSVITNEDSVNLLKAASEKRSRRIVNWLTTRSSEYGFEFQGKIVIITNVSVNKSPHLEAIKDRFHVFDMNITYKMKLAKIQDIANNTSDRFELAINNEIVEYLLLKQEEINKDKISIRTFIKLKEIAMLMPDRWREFAEISGTYFDKTKITSSVIKRPRILSNGLV